MSEVAASVLTDDEDTVTVRVPKIGDTVWYIMEDRDGLVALPGILHKQELDGTWSLNYFREEALVYVNHVGYCGANWQVCQWCWPGEQPASTPSNED